MMPAPCSACDGVGAKDGAVCRVCKGSGRDRDLTKHLDSNGYARRVHRLEQAVLALATSVFVNIPADELVDEHEKLVKALKSHSHKDDKQEAKEQGDELKKFEKMAANNARGGGSLPDITNDEVTGNLGNEETKEKDRIVRPKTTPSGAGRTADSAAKARVLRKPRSGTVTQRVM